MDHVSPIILSRSSRLFNEEEGGDNQVLDLRRAGGQHKVRWGESRFWLEDASRLNEPRYWLREFVFCREKL